MFSKGFVFKTKYKLWPFFWKRGMVVLCTECKYSVTLCWNKTKVYWQFYSIMLTWKYEPWKIYISVSFTFPSVVGKPISYSRHDLDDMVQPILERWKAEGITDIICRSLYFDKPIYRQSKTINSFAKYPLQWVITNFI